MAGGFDAFGLLPELVKAVSELNWILPTPVQDETIPLILGGGDVMVAAETGSGKTAAFALPTIQCVYERLSKNPKEKVASSSATAVVTLNSDDRDAMCQILESDLACFNGGKGWAGCRGTHGVSHGKYFYECSIKGSGICRMGWSTMAAHYEVGKDANGFGYGGTGKKSHNSIFEDYGTSFHENDVIGCCIDLDAWTISYTKNGKALGIAFTIPENKRSVAFFPAIVLKEAGLRVNFGATAFQYPVAGYRGIQQADPLHIVSAKSREAFSSGSKRKPMAIVIEPSRELAQQVYDNFVDFLKFIRNPSLVPVLLVGQSSDKALSRDVDIVVGTPGKLMDLSKRGSLDLSCIRFFILDEADRFSDDKENYNIVMSLFQKCPERGIGENRLQVCMLSATLHSPDIIAMSERMCQNPQFVDLKGRDAVPDTVHHVLIQLDLARDSQWLTKPKVAAVTDNISKLLPSSDQQVVNSQRIKELKQHALVKLIDTFKMTQCLIFCRTNEDCNNLEAFLIQYGGGMKFRPGSETGKENPYSCCVLAGMRSNEDRALSLEAFKEGQVRFLICTDGVAARGIDIKALPFVVNMTLPDKAADYIHRIGRVGRADRMGLAFSIVAPPGMRERVWYHKCANRGKDCSNTKLVDQGGCTIWYNETELLGEITKLLKVEAIPQMQLPSFTLPPSIANQNAEYGELVSDNSAGSTARVAQQQRIMQVQDKLLSLVSMEVAAQDIFLSYKRQRKV